MVYAILFWLETSRLDSTIFSLIFDNTIVIDQRVFYQTASYYAMSNIIIDNNWVIKLSCMNEMMEQ